MSEGTVRRRLGALLNQRVVHVSAIVEPTYLGFYTSAFIGLQVDPSRVEAIAAHMADLVETEHVAITTGNYDIFIWVNLSGPAALASFLHHTVALVEGVRHTETFVSLEVKKHRAGPGVRP
mgnify:CR=1 FL=1